MKFSTFIQDIKQRLFASDSPSSHKVSETIILEKKPVDKPKISVTDPLKITRQPYFIQIGFDFGTSYSKCVCRDVVTGKAWVHIPVRSDVQEQPFLIPSVIKQKDGILSVVDNPAYHYPENGLYHLKQAMVKTAMKQWDDPVLTAYKESIGTTEPYRIRDFVKSSAVFYLARISRRSARTDTKTNEGFWKSAGRLHGCKSGRACGGCRTTGNQCFL
jgi:hypothetical protein